jgi:cytochrome P450
MGGMDLLDAPLRGGDLVDDPYPFYARLRRDAPIWRLPGSDAFLVATWDLVAEATARPEDFSNHFRHTLGRAADDTVSVETLDAGVDVFAGADPPAHAEHRRLFFPELVQARMRSLEPTVRALADTYVDGLIDAGGGEACNGLADSLPMQVMAEHVIGFRDVDSGQLRAWVFAGSRFMGGRLRDADAAEVALEAAGLLPWVSAQLAAALASDTGGVLGAAAQGVRAGVLTRDEAAFTLMVLLGAGGETTTSLIGNAIRLLAERPEVQALVRSDPAAIPSFVEEVLRFESPFRFHHRSAPRDTELGGVAVPAGALVMLLWGSANRDERVFDAADAFVVGRPDASRHLGFGRGIHHCVGAPLARLEARIVLERLLARTRSIGLDADDPPRWADSLWIRRHDRLPVVLEPA